MACMLKHSLRLSLCLYAFAAVTLAGDAQAPRSPQSLFSELFTAVQEERVFRDGKTFPDAQPKASPEQILRDYRREHPKGEALKDFVGAHFEIPVEVKPAASPSAQVPLAEHIDGLWQALTRRSADASPYSSLLPLSRPYVVPGGRFREMYYWDSYFTMLGLGQARRDLLEDMVGNFADLIERYGHVPNGTRTYYLSRSQPPFFFAMVGLLSPDDPAAAYDRYLPQLRREYAFWMEGETGLAAGKAHRRVVAMGDGSILNRYWDDSDLPRDEAYFEDTELARRAGRPGPEAYRDIRAAAESGWDFGSRWFAESGARESIVTTQIVPVDLNSLLFGLEQAIAAGCRHRRDAECARQFADRAVRRQRAVNRYLWDASGSYYDYRWTEGRRIERISAAIFYPLFTSMASAQQAQQVAATGRRALLKFGGLVTTTATTGQQWDAPNGWAPLQWIANQGLRNYQQTELAATLACRWLVNVEAVYRQTGKLVEKYDVVNSGREGGGGEYPNQDGFGWTNGVTRRLMELYPDVLKHSPSRCAEG